jgi:hypothetical protein
VAASPEGDLESAVGKTFGLQAIGNPRLREKVGRAGLEHAGSYARENVLPASALEDQGVDARPVQELPEQKPCGARSDDGDLGAHGFDRPLP